MRDPNEPRRKMHSSFLLRHKSLAIFENVKAEHAFLPKEIKIHSQKAS